MDHSLPDFIIVGTQKSGSTSLHHHFQQHPEIHMPDGEPQFFSKDRFYEKGMESYLNHIHKGKSPEATLVGEKSPTYSFKPVSAQRMHKHVPDTKLVWIFRNPIDRTYSNYLHSIANGTEHYSFRKALDKEEVRRQKYFFRGYKHRSHYHEQVARFLQFYPKEQMIFLLFEELVNGPDELNNAFQFLGVDPKRYVPAKKKSNPTILPRFPYLNYKAQQWGLKRNRITKKISHIVNFSGVKPGYPTLSADYRAELGRYFAEYNKQLEELIGRDLSIWNQ